MQTNVQERFYLTEITMDGSQLRRKQLDFVDGFNKNRNSSHCLGRLKPKKLN